MTATRVNLPPPEAPRFSGIDVGEQLMRIAARLYPICRSITGNGVRESLRIIAETFPLTVHEVPTGTQVYDWEVPLEWNIESAHVTGPNGRPVIDFGGHNLHVVSYSEPTTVTLPLAELEKHLHSLPQRPEWIPYRTSYYSRSWGFCLPHNQRRALTPGRYHVDIRSSLARGALTYGDTTIAGRTRDEVLFFTHVCHPSLANDNASGMAIAIALAAWVASEPRRYTYRFVFAPGTIGSLCWLKKNERNLGRIRAGLVLALLGDSGGLTYKESRDGNTLTDTVARYALAQIDSRSNVVAFSPYGYDERQLCSPGFNLPVGRLTRSVNGGYPQYHTSADDLDLITPACLKQSLDACKLFVTVLEGDRRYVNLSPKGEPRLGKRGLYGKVGGRSPSEREQAMLWVLNQSDGSKSLLEVANRSGLSFDVVRDAAKDLKNAGLLRERTGASTRVTTWGRSKVERASNKARMRSGARRATHT